jgi:hypothetical protein
MGQLLRTQLQADRDQRGSITCSATSTAGSASRPVRCSPNWPKNFEPRLAAAKVVAITYYGDPAGRQISRSASGRHEGAEVRVPDAPLCDVSARGQPVDADRLNEIYLALQNGGRCAGESAADDRCEEVLWVQKYIVLTVHITDALLTIVGGPTWNKLSEADRKIFEDVLKEAAARATAGQPW